MKRWRTILEVAANIALVVCCVLLGGVLIKNYLHGDKQEARSSPSPVSLVGKKISVSNIDWSQNERTLLVILQKGCHFCEESVPFYQRLTKELSSQQRTHLLAVLPSSSDENRQYLKDQRIDIDDVRQSSLASIGVRGTPTIVLVDNSGTVLEQWNGKLPPLQEDLVIARLKQ